MVDGLDVASPDGRDGTWDVVLDKLTAAADCRAVDWWVPVESTAARPHQHAAHVTRRAGAESNYTNLTRAA